MASEWWFYHLERPPLAAALAPLFEKCLERGWRVLVSSDHAATLAEIDADLWKYKDDSFLPHGMAGSDAARQPVLLTQSLENENQSAVLVLLNGQDTGAADVPYERIMVVFEDQDGQARQMARQQFSRARSNDQTVRYFQQTENGGWAEKKA